MEKDDYFVPNDATVGISSAAFSADFEFEANNIEMELLKEKFSERLKEIKDKRTAESERSLASQLRLSKMSREKVFATIWQQTVSKLTRLKMSDMNYARLAALILRKESELHKLTDSSGYLYLVVDMFYALENQLVKYKELNVPIEVQTETCDLDQVGFTLKICHIYIYSIHKRVCISYLNIRKILSVKHFDSVCHGVIKFFFGTYAGKIEFW